MFIVDYTGICPTHQKRYFRNMVPEVAIVMCEKTGKFFLEDEYAFANLESPVFGKVPKQSSN